MSHADEHAHDEDSEHEHEHDDEPGYVAGVSPVAEAPGAARLAFLRKTYLHLAGAILVFTALEALLMQIPEVEDVALTMTNGYNWLAVLGAFMAVSWVADYMARRSTSLWVQYLGLVLYVCAEAVIFIPLIYVAANYGGDDVIPTAAIATVAVFVGLSAIVLVSKKDFSYLRAGLTIASMVALGVIVAGVLFGFELGVLFSVAMIGLAAAYILYYTSNVLHHYRTTQYVAAALALFSAVALLFWYILRLLLEIFGNRR
jgi:FtsH-binding integral membrane protein